MYSILDVSCGHKHPPEEDSNRKSWVKVRFMGDMNRSMFVIVESNLIFLRMGQCFPFRWTFSNSAFAFNNEFERQWIQCVLEKDGEISCPYWRTYGWHIPSQACRERHIKCKSIEPRCLELYLFSSKGVRETAGDRCQRCIDNDRRCFQGSGHRFRQVTSVHLNRDDDGSTQHHLVFTPKQKWVKVPAKSTSLSRLRMQNII